MPRRFTAQDQVQPCSVFYFYFFIKFELGAGKWFMIVIEVVVEGVIIISFNMPRKVVITKAVFESSKKRNLSATQDKHSTEDSVRNIKKKKCDYVRSGNKGKTATDASRAVLPVHSKQTASTSAAPAHVNNENGEASNEPCIIYIDSSEALVSEQSVLNTNISRNQCIQRMSQMKKLRNFSAPDASVMMITPCETEVNDSKVLEEMTCIICMNTKRALRYKSLECGHNFHHICINTWLKCNNCCPICMPYNSERNSLIDLDQDICETHEHLPCSICLDTVESSNFECLSCFHTFHVACIQTWFEVKESCPICNVPDLHQDEFSDLRETMQCMICMNTEIFSDFEFLLCDHSFHAICLENWFQVHTACPICVPYDTANILVNDFQGANRDAEQCAICMGTEVSFDLTNLSCGHSFHVMCIQTWFQIRKSCPICTPSVSATQNLNLFSNDNNKDQRCMICMNSDESLEFEVISCDLGNNIWHAFHSKCIETWFQVNDSCPVCIPDIAVNSAPNLTEEEDSEAVRCAICVDTEENSVMEFLACCHSFHSICIQNWLKRKNKCPICNTVISVNGNFGRGQEETQPCA